MPQSILVNDCVNEDFPDVDVASVLIATFKKHYCQILFDIELYGSCAIGFVNRVVPLVKNESNVISLVTICGKNSKTDRIYKVKKKGSCWQR